jgi:hypothetical protein
MQTFTYQPYTDFRVPSPGFQESRVPSLAFREPWVPSPGFQEPRVWERSHTRSHQASCQQPPLLRDRAPVPDNGAESNIKQHNIKQLSENGCEILSFFRAIMIALQINAKNNTTTYYLHTNMDYCTCKKKWSVENLIRIVDPVLMDHYVDPLKINERSETSVRIMGDLCKKLNLHIAIYCVTITKANSRITGSVPESILGPRLRIRPKSTHDPVIRKNRSCPGSQKISIAHWTDSKAISCDAKYTDPYTLICSPVSYFDHYLAPGTGTGTLLPRAMLPGPANHTTIATRTTIPVEHVPVPVPGELTRDKKFQFRADQSIRERQYIESVIDGLNLKKTKVDLEIKKLTSELNCMKEKNQATRYLEDMCENILASSTEHGTELEKIIDKISLILSNNVDPGNKKYIDGLLVDASKILQLIDSHNLAINNENKQLVEKTEIFKEDEEKMKLLIRMRMDGFQDIDNLLQIIVRNNTVTAH